MDNLEMQILDEAISFLNTGKMTLDHRNNFINTYTKISHIPVNNKTGFYLFHNDILKKMQEDITGEKGDIDPADYLGDYDDDDDYNSETPSNVNFYSLIFYT